MLCFNLRPVYRSEQHYVQERHRTFNMEPEQGIAVCLSGGGIRAAAFGLGLLRALEEASLLHHMDHLSSVSGGGYTATAWATEVLSNPDRLPGTLAEARKNVKVCRSFVWDAMHSVSWRSPP